MKKVVIISVSLFVGLIVLLIIKIQRWINEIDYGFASGVRPLASTLNSINLFIPMWFYNPTPFGIIVSDLDLSVYFDKNFVAKVLSEKAYKIVSKEKSVVPITMKIDTKSVLKYLADYGTIINDPDWLKKVNVTMVGTISVDLGLIKIRNIPFQYTDNLKYYVG